MADFNIKPKVTESIWFNDSPHRKIILDMTLEGKSLKEISEAAGVKEHVVVYTMNHAHFLNKLNRHLQVMYNKLCVDKVRVQKELIDLLMGTLTKTLPAGKRLDMTAEKIVKELVTLTKTDTNQVRINKIQQNNTFNNHGNVGADRDRNPVKEEEEELKLLKSFGIVKEAETIEDENDTE